ncbi:DUF1799 domain-containing protein [Rugamonas rubra]|uniref:DUF1799 domain-containing protein n=1 Tax=Rugamonas rubra TaxID=758825 RepID=A0A1I4SGF2_9BURK|nr:DUF1799 domain-containing protein [Rugamonas rubra]SFM63547.1 Phage related hypothetical protein [Rugamonas rubra]
MAAFGLTAEDVAADPIDIWPDNLNAFQIFSFLGTQWRVGMSGATGLDYNVMYRKMDRLALSPGDYDELERDIQIMESAALAYMHQKKT